MSVINNYKFIHCRCMNELANYYTNQNENNFRAVQFECIDFK